MTADAAPATPVARTKALAAIAVLYALAAGTSWFARDLYESVQRAFPASGSAYWVPGEALLLYVAAPLVFLATVIFWIAPGLLVVAAAGTTRRVTEWLVLALPCALVLQTLGCAAGKAIGGTPMARGGFFVSSIGVTVVCWILLAVRTRRERPLVLPVQGAANRRRLLLVALVLLVGVGLLLPMMFWQDVNGDGIEALEFGMSLARHQVPRSLHPPGLNGLGGGQVSQSYVLFPFTALYGPFEAAVRLPLLLALALIFCVLLELIERPARSNLAAPSEVLILGALGTYAMVMVYSASFSPYSADPSSPGTIDTFALLFQLGAIYALLSKRKLTFVAFVLLAHFARPNSLMLLGLLFLASVVAMRADRRRFMQWTGLAVILCIGATLLYEQVYIPATLGSDTPTAGTDSIASRLRFLTFTDWWRVAFLIVPSGVIPAVSLLFYKRQDEFSRMLTLVILAYFLFFYVNAFVSLHHFAPIMVLPLVVFWRLWTGLPKTQRKAFAGLATVGVAVSFWLACPPHFRVSRTVREVGQRTAVLLGDPDEGYRAIVGQVMALDAVFPRVHEVDDPSREWAGGSIPIAYYAQRSGAITDRIDYVVLPTHAPPPADMLRIQDKRGGTLYVRSRETMRRDRHRRFDTDFASPLFALPREVLHKYPFGWDAKRYDVDLKELLPTR